VVYLLGYLFGGGPEPAPCGPCEGGEDLPPPWTALRKASAGTADINGDWRINVSDPIALLGYLFADGPPPVPCGVCWPGGAHLLPATGLRGCCRGYPEEEGGWGALQVPCNDPAWPGQDAQTQLGCPPEERFVDNGDGTITDLCTGLMWQKKPPTVPPEYEGDEYGMTTWQGALRYANDLEFAGYDDWRLPNLHELVFISDWYNEGWPPTGLRKNVYPFEWPEKRRPAYPVYWTSSATEYYWHRVVFKGFGVITVNEPPNRGSQCGLLCRAYVRCVRGPIWIQEK